MGAQTVLFAEGGVLSLALTQAQRWRRVYEAIQALQAGEHLAVVPRADED